MQYYIVICLQWLQKCRKCFTERIIIKNTFFVIVFNVFTYAYHFNDQINNYRLRKKKNILNGKHEPKTNISVLIIHTNYAYLLY